MLPAWMKRNVWRSRILRMALLSSVWACTPSGELQLSLERPASPDPFFGVEALRVWARGPSGLSQLGGGRWDQGAFQLSGRAPSDTTRLIVEGLDAEGDVVASGVSEALDLLAAPGPVTVYFSRVGALSTLEDAIDGGVLQLQLLARGADALLIGAPAEAGECGPTQVWRLGGVGARLQLGPALSEPRGPGVYPAFLPNGDALIFGGAAACGSEGTARLSPELALTETPALDPLPQAALFVRSSEQLLLLGGEVGGRASDEAQVLLMSTLYLTHQGSLETPRAGARAISGSPDRVLLVGGAAAGVARSDATVYRPSAGNTEGSWTPIGAPRIRPALHLNPAGGVWIAGGEDERGQGNARLQQLHFMDAPVRSSPLLSLTATIGAAGAVDLEDGGALFLPEAAGPLLWVRPLPLAAASIEAPEALSGAPLSDGTVILVGASGQLYTFNPGTAWLTGAGLTGAPLTGSSLNLIPRDPRAWSQTEEGLVGTSTAAELRSGWAEWLRVGAEDWGDFLLELELKPDGKAQLFLPFAQSVTGGYAIQLSSRSWVGYFDNSGTRGVDCETAETPTLSELDWVRLRLSRSGDLITLDVGADDSPELRCVLPAGVGSGGLGLGLSGGSVTVRQVSLRRR